MTFAPRTKDKNAYAGPHEGAATVDGTVRRIELRIPLGDLKLRGQAGTAVGFDLAIDDADAEGKYREVQLIWTGSKYNYRDPSHYGVLLFAE